ncbi:hypothetical protein PM082_019619 [Marasmius tenuissimus]|nr:hypothetical protein PM082_019619 [Marasmius tenuissimus]
MLGSLSSLLSVQDGVVDVYFPVLETIYIYFESFDEDDDAVKGAIQQFHRGVEAPKHIAEARLIFNLPAGTGEGRSEIIKYDGDMALTRGMRNIITITK